LTGCNADQARIAVLELAKLHGPRLGDPTLGDIEWLSRRGLKTDAGSNSVRLSAMFCRASSPSYTNYLSPDAAE
jgi:hypothetical protein